MKIAHTLQSQENTYMMHKWGNCEFGVQSSSPILACLPVCAFILTFSFSNRFSSSCFLFRSSSSPWTRWFPSPNVFLLQIFFFFVFLIRGPNILLLFLCGPSPKSLDSDKNFKTYHTLFCCDIKICHDLRSFRMTLGKKMFFFW